MTELELINSPEAEPEKIVDLRLVEKVQIQERLIEPLPVPSKKYDVIISDPPWPYGVRVKDRSHRGRIPYPEMEMPLIKTLPVPQLAKKHCIIYLWTTNSFMGEAFECLKTWGFENKTILTWVKTTKDGSQVKMGLGNWLRNCTEHCLIAVKGSPASPAKLGNLKRQTTYLEAVEDDSGILYAAQREHSRKPDEFYEMVRSLNPGDRLEMFAREQREGFDAWGAEVDKFN